MKTLMPLFLMLAASAALGGTAETEPEVTVEIYSDFQCPFCKGAAEPVRQLQQKGVPGVRVAVQFRNFPLDFHRDAPLAHQAALAAKRQGKFWEMHDAIFAAQQSIQRADLLAHAQRIGLDMARFTRDMDSEEVKKELAEEKAGGAKRGVQGTPTFFVNGKSQSGAKTYDQLAKLIRDERNRAEVLREVSDASMSRGPADARVTVEFFADLQSPVSRPALTAIEQVMLRSPGAVRLQFRNFPLAFHPNAGLAHEAAMIAARQGKFWEFLAFILDHQDSLREQELVALAGRLGLDAAAFAADLASHRYAPRVDADVAAGLGRGIRGSPVVFVNGHRIDGVPALDQLIERVEQVTVARK